MTCLNKLTSNKKDFQCPSCKHKVKSGTLQFVAIKTPEEMELEKENAIRKEIQNQFLLISRFSSKFL